MTDEYVISVTSRRDALWLTLAERIEGLRSDLDAAIPKTSPSTARSARTFTACFRGSHDTANF